MGTPEGLAIHRAKLVEALHHSTADGAAAEDLISGLAHHGDESAPHISPARQALLEFDRRHPQVLAAVAAARGQNDTSAQ
jgi:hypothetical protein